MFFYEIAVDFPKDGLLTYKSYRNDHKIGELVQVSLGRRKAKGCIVQEISENDLSVAAEKIKEIDQEDGNELVLPKDYLELFTWMAKYYHYPLGKLIFDCMPKVLKRPRKLNSDIGEGQEINFEGDPDREKIVSAISSSCGYNDFFIHGVTGSGKSFIYLKLIQEKLKQGKSVLFLIPEINLSPQFIKFFKTYVNTEIYTYNSQVSGSQKYGLYKKSLETKNPIVIIGVRSSVFLPINNLGLIVVDEFHDQSFKQEDRCRYSAKDVAIKLAKIKNVPVVIGSATPNTETFYHYKKTRKENFFELRKRFGESVLPEIIISSEKNESRDEIWPFYESTLSEIESTLISGKKVIIYANKLGYSSFIECRSCHYIFECPNCSVPLKFYRNKNILSCHYCGLKEKKHEHCPSCSSITFLYQGFGTERIKSILEERFPGKIIKRFDRDVLKNHDDLQNILDEIQNGEIDVLVGTQMISKGHNFKDIEKVVVLGADQALNIPDFRSNEKLFQSLTQIAGRAGRFGERGKVIIQTSYPDNRVFDHLKESSFNEFYEEELNLRTAFKMPPYGKLAMIYLSGKTQSSVQKYAMELYHGLDQVNKSKFGDVTLIYPRPALIEKLVNKFTWCLFVQSENVQNLHNLITIMEKCFPLPSQISRKIDIDPYNFY